jgi:hypothetical protein
MAGPRTRFPHMGERARDVTGWRPAYGALDNRHLAVMYLMLRLAALSGNGTYHAVRMSHTLC